MGKGVFKYGGKSGILPKVRPVFKRFPIRPKNEAELDEEAKIITGYASNVPLPKRRGFEFHRKAPTTPIMTVEDRIKRNIDDRVPKDVDESKLSPDEIWQLRKDEVRRKYLKEAYLVESERLKKVDEYKAKIAKKEEEYAKAHTYKVSEADKLTLPTIDSYLKGSIVRPRTEEETILLEEQRILNRKTNELRVKEEKATKLLDLYHAAADFITTEEELEIAISKAFEENSNAYDSAESTVNQLLSIGSSMVHAKHNEELISNTILGQLNGKPGLQNITENLSCETEKMKREAQLTINQNREI